MHTDSPLHPHRWKALVVLALSLLVVTVDNTILNVALPTIRSELDASSSELQWIVDSYLLVFAGLLLAAGTLGDRFGRRRALFVGLAIFFVGSLLAALSGGSTALIASRALMGVGGAAIMPTTLSIISNIFPAHERPKAIAVWAAVAGLGVAIGPTTGGFLIEHFAWSSVFLVNLPVIVVCLVAGAILIPESRDPASPRIDVAGVVLSIAGLTAVVWGLIEAPERGWTSGTILLAFGGGAAILAAFVAWERRCDEPMLDVDVFRNLRFSAASASVTFVFFALMGVMYFLTTYLQSVLGYSALQAGVRTLPVAAGVIVASRLSVGLTRRFGTKVMVASGLGMVAGALGLLATVDGGSGYGLVAAALSQMGIGMGLTMAPATDAIMGTLPKEKAGVGSAMNDVGREVGGTLGVAVLGSVLSSGYASGMSGATDGLPAGAAAVASDSVGAAHEVAADIGGGLGASLIASADAAFIDAMATAAAVGAGAAAMGALVALAFLPARPGRDPDEARTLPPEMVPAPA
jgi:EmrB/QacA subfamily drug resistance transporter